MIVELVHTHYFAGNNFLRKQDFYNAIQCYREALKIDPTFFKAYINMGVAYKKMKKLREAERVYKEALRLKPNSGVAFNNIGNVYMELNDLAKAEGYYRRALQVYPQYKEALYNLGQVLYFTGKRDEAMEMRIRLEKASGRAIKT